MAITQIAEIYEAEYRYGDPSTLPPVIPPATTWTPAGWFDAQRTVTAWFDDDWVKIAERIPLQLVELLPGFFSDPDVFISGVENVPHPLPSPGPGGPRPPLPPQYQPHITVEVYHDARFNDEDAIFHPVAIRKLDPPDRYLKNEVIRIR